MTAQLVESVRAFLSSTKLTPTAAQIAATLNQPVIDTGKALDELQGLGHARADALHRWRITDMGRLAAPPVAETGVTRRTRPSAMDARTYIQRIAGAIGNELLTTAEIAKRTGLDKDLVSRNITMSGKNHGIVKAGKHCETGLTIYRRLRACETGGTDVKEPDRAAIAAGQDKEEAATTKPDIM